MQKKHDLFLDSEKRQYQSPIPSRELILEQIQALDKPISASSLSEVLGVTQKDILLKRLTAMVRDGQLIKDKKDRYRTNKMLDLVLGTVILLKSGEAFIEGAEERIYLSAYQARDLINKDEVLVRPTIKDMNGHRQGVLVEIKKRNTHFIHGIYSVRESGSYLMPFLQMKGPILVKPDDKVADGDVILAHVCHFASRRGPMLVEVEKILGRQETPGIESKLAQSIYAWPGMFSDAALKQVDTFSDRIDLGDRLDWRDKPFVTIDGKDSKDFDDAVYVCQQSYGWDLYVAIADVSFYVKSGTDLDEDAKLRATSVYFPDRVLPMLPERLSNDLCSLKPNVDRYAVGVYMKVTHDGKVIGQNIDRVVIQSKSRLTYQSVQDMLDGKQETLSWFKVPLADFKSLTHCLLEAREKRGAIEFNQSEPQFKLGPNQKIQSILIGKRLFTHRMIEEAMLLCNETTAKMLIQRGIGGIYRNHLPPDLEKMQALEMLLSELSIDCSQGVEHVIRHLSELSQSQREIIQNLIIRSLKQARYQESPEGHFGLSLDFYTHFTSPIRRYPDLMVHRLLLGENQSSALGALAEHCSDQERIADEAVRDAVAWLKAHYMSQKIGQIFQGVISAVMPFGVFVTLNDLGIDGLVHISELLGDYYQYDAEKMILTGRQTGGVFKIGDALSVRVNRVSIWEMKIDFILNT
ncbi:MAG: ribonuclease R [Gammaproteobacteria bacterium]|nr:ribonuclease R [Gammaproteobacteria bacterium]